MLKHAGNGILFLVYGLVLFGCATTDDPHEGGYFDALHAMSTGSYDKRLQNKQAELLAHYSINFDLKSQKDKLDAEKKQIDDELIANQESLDSLQKELNDFDEKLTVARAKGRLEKKTYNKLRQQVAALSKQARSNTNDNGDLQGKRVHIKELTKRKQLLEDSMQKAINKL